MRDLNLRPRHYQWRALTSWANRPQMIKIYQQCSWWALRGSNPRPSRCKRDALANWAKRPHAWVTEMVECPRSKPGSPHMVEQRGLEPRTPCLQSRCSSQLSYCPIIKCTSTHVRLYLFYRRCLSLTRVILILFIKNTRSIATGITLTI